jgi:hypothetical protein
MPPTPITSSVRPAGCSPLPERSEFPCRTARSHRSGCCEPPGPGRNGERDFHGAGRRNDTHVSTTEPEARLDRKGKEAKLCFVGHLLMENRHGLIVDGRGNPGLAPDRRRRRQGLGHGRLRGRDARVGRHAPCRPEQLGPPLRDRRTTRHPGYAVSQRLRRRIEDGLAWIKEIALQRRARHRGTLAAAAYDLIRL